MVNDKVLLQCNGCDKLILAFMKPKIHPTYYPEAKVSCACGQSFTVGSTRPEMHVEICSNCHPFYTGKQKLVDTARRVERFTARAERQATVAAVRKGRKAKKAQAAVRKSNKKPAIEREE